jgi:hypothetical protein
MYAECQGTGMVPDELCQQVICGEQAKKVRPKKVRARNQGLRMMSLTAPSSRKAGMGQATRWGAGRCFTSSHEVARRDPAGRYASASDGIGEGDVAAALAVKEKRSVRRLTYDDFKASAPRKASGSEGERKFQLPQPPRIAGSSSSGWRSRWLQ